MQHLDVDKLSLSAKSAAK